MSLEDFKYLMFPMLILNYILTRKMDSRNKLLYKNIQKNLMVFGFIYLLGVCMITLSNNNSSIDAIHIMIPLMSVLILPIVILKLESMNILHMGKLQLKFITIFNIFYSILVVVIILFYFLNREHYLNRYSFYGLFYLVLIFFLVNFNENTNSKNM